MSGLIPRDTLYSFPPTSNSTSTAALLVRQVVNDFPFVHVLAERAVKQGKSDRVQKRGFAGPILSSDQSGLVRVERDFRVDVWI